MLPETLSLPLSIDFAEVTSELTSQYSRTKRPIEVSFRSLVPSLNNPDRATHLIHTYPAKLLMHIPHFFINNSKFSKPGDTVLDPFCGSGTVLLESILAKRNAVGVDANPLARLITEVKTTAYDTKTLRAILEKLKEDISNKRLSINFPNIDYWFYPKVQEELASISYSIEKIQDQKHKDFFKVCFSNCVKKVSLADPRVSVPVKINPNRYPENSLQYNNTLKKLDELKSLSAISKFFEVVESNISRFEKLALATGEHSIHERAKIVSSDARCLQPTGQYTGLSDESVDIVITSPPYAGAQKYIRSSSLSLGWLNYLTEQSTLRELDSRNIGRENYQKNEYSKLPVTNILEADSLLQQIAKKNKLRAYIAANYLIEMRSTFAEIFRVLKNNHHFVLVAANNEVCGYEFKTQEFLVSIAESIGFEITLRLIDEIKSYGLMTKRNKTASIITREWVLVFKKIK